MADNWSKVSRGNCFSAFINKNSFLFLTLISLLPSLCLQAKSQQIESDPDYYSFYPKSILSLGVSFSPNELTRPKTRCIEGTPTPLEPGALNTQFSSVLVTNSEQLKTALSLDTKMDASYLAYTGGGQFTFKNEGLFETDSLTVVVTASTEFGRVSYQVRPTLAADIKPLLSDGPKFAKVCGTRYVAIERRGASVSAILNLASVHNEDKTNITANMSASGGWGPLSGKASTEFQAELARAATSSRLSVQVVSTGGVGFGGLADLVAALATKPQSLEPIQKALGEYLKTFKDTNAAPIGYHIGSMEDFGWDPNSVNLWNLQKERHLREIVEKYREIESRAESAKGIIAGSDPRASLLSQDKLARIRDALPSYQEYLDALAEAHKTCKENTNLKDCKVPKPNTPLEDIPPMPKPPQTTYVVVADGTRLDLITSRAIFFSARYPLLTRARVYKANAQAAQVLLNIKGSYLVTCRLIFRPQGEETIKVPVDLLQIKDNGADYELEDSENGPAVLSDKISNFMYKLQPEGNGTFSLQLQDQLGRRFGIDVLTAKWKVTPNSAEVTENNVEY